jgi:hypothetical protein
VGQVVRQVRGLLVEAVLGSWQEPRLLYLDLALSEGQQLVQFREWQLLGH